MNDELSAMHDRALQAEQELIEARNYHKDEVARLEDEIATLKACKMGVGDGSGQLFVYGDYDSIKAAQAIVLERDGLLAQLKNKQPARPVDAFVTVIGLCTDLGQVKTIVEHIDLLFREHTSNFLLSEDDWLKLTRAVSAAKRQLPGKERPQDRVARRYSRLQDELYRSGKITIGEAYVSMTVVGQCPAVTEFDAAIDKLLEHDQHRYDAAHPELVLDPHPEPEQNPYFSRSPSELCVGASCDVCGGTGIFEGRKCDGIPF